MFFFVPHFSWNFFRDILLSGFFPREKKNSLLRFSLILRTFTRTIACENIRFSSLFSAGDVSRGGTSPTQRQKFHTDDVNQCLKKKYGSHGVPNTNLFNFSFLLVDFGKVLCSSTNELQQNLNAFSRED